MKEQIDGRLTVIEEESVFLVTREEDPTDWLVCFDKAEGFDARGWAENMVRVYNRRLDRISHTRSAGADQGHRGD